MNGFTRLFVRLDRTTRTTEKVAALVDYFAAAPPDDAAWAIFFLAGEKITRPISTKLLRQWAAEKAGIEPWMFDECYEITGDLAEVTALILPPPTTKSDLPLAEWVSARLMPMRKMEEHQQREQLQRYWSELDEPSRLVLHKLITGSFRVGVSRKLVVQAIARYSGIAPEIIAHRLMGDWQPTAESYRTLLDPDTRASKIGQPYPFYLAHPLEKGPDSLGDLSEWMAEWKWDGIRAQVLKREGAVFIWSRGEELVTDRFPELASAAMALADGTVLDGEIVALKNGSILPFGEMQRRIGRKKPGRKILQEVPVSFIAFDLIEIDGVDIRDRSQEFRRRELETVIGNLGESVTADRFRLSTVHAVTTWQEVSKLRNSSRESQAEGLMLKRRSSPYRVGRPRGDWWKWKIEPYTIDAVLIYAQRGHGRRASLYTDYTFAVWDHEQLVPFAKAYSGLTDEEIRRVDSYVRRNTLERFGPVRSVTPRLVFELAFENIQSSARHKSGIAVRFPRIIRWREDLTIEDADSLETIRGMMNAS